MRDPTAVAEAITAVREIGGDLESAIYEISVPTYVLDAQGVIRSLNPAAKRLVGDVTGRQFTSVVAHEDSRRAREHFARKIAGNDRVTDSHVILRGANGEHVQCEFSSVALTDEGHRVVGVFGQISDVEEMADRPELPALTPRQTEVLRLLERGRSTEQIASELHISRETARNHIRRLLRALNVHTRLEAVAVAHHGGLQPVAA
jgi:PAS domain S-box-containing protein